MGRFWLLVVAWVHLLLLFGSSPSEGITSSLFHRSKPSHQCGTSYFATQVTSAVACGAICSTEDKCLGFSLGVAMNSKRRCEVVETSDNCNKNSNFDYYSRSGTKTTTTSSMSTATVPPSTTPTTTATTTPTTTTTPPPSTTTATATTTTPPPTTTTTATTIPTTTTTPPPSTTPTTTATTTATTTTTPPASTTTTATTTTLPPSTTPTTPTTVTTPTSTTPQSSTTLTTASSAVLLEAQTDEVVTGIQTDNSKKILTDLMTQQLQWVGSEYSKLEGEQCDANGAITATLSDTSKFW
ncbi:integumentary mucin C.1-like isoform X2 [Portunus trituberculatus]|nr:integumentary mucin C.1-like isoform X2 [Portunus trituberculatus]